MSIDIHCMLDQREHQRVLGRGVCCGANQRLPSQFSKRRWRVRGVQVLIISYSCVPVKRSPLPFHWAKFKRPMRAHIKQETAAITETFANADPNPPNANCPLIKALPRTMLCNTNITAKLLWNLVSYSTFLEIKTRTLREIDETKDTETSGFIIIDWIEPSEVWAGERIWYKTRTKRHCKQEKEVYAKRRGIGWETTISEMCSSCASRASGVCVLLNRTRDCRSASNLWKTSSVNKLRS